MNRGRKGRGTESPARRRLVHKSAILEPGVEANAARDAGAAVQTLTEGFWRMQLSQQSLDGPWSSRGGPSPVPGPAPAPAPSPDPVPSRPNPCPGAGLAVGATPTTTDGSGAGMAGADSSGGRSFFRGEG